MNKARVYYKLLLSLLVLFLTVYYTEVSNKSERERERSPAARALTLPGMSHFDLRRVSRCNRSSDAARVSLCVYVCICVRARFALFWVFYSPSRRQSSTVNTLKPSTGIVLLALASMSRNPRQPARTIHSALCISAR